MITEYQIEVYNNGEWTVFNDIPARDRKEAQDGLTILRNWYADGSRQVRLVRLVSRDVTEWEPLPDPLAEAAARVEAALNRRVEWATVSNTMPIAADVRLLVDAVKAAGNETGRSVEMCSAVNHWHGAHLVSVSGCRSGAVA